VQTWFERVVLVAVADGIAARLVAQRARRGGEEIVLGLLDRGEILEARHAGENVLDEIGDVLLVADAAFEEAAQGRGVAARDGVQPGAGWGVPIGVTFVVVRAHEGLARDGGLAGMHDQEA